MPRPRRRTREPTTRQIATAAVVLARRADRRAARLEKRIRTLEAEEEHEAIGFRVLTDFEEDEIPAEVRRRR